MTWKMNNLSVFSRSWPWWHVEEEKEELHQRQKADSAHGKENCRLILMCPLTKMDESSGNRDDRKRPPIPGQAM